jgi:hypothetical protein
MRRYIIALVLFIGSIAVFGQNSTERDIIIKVIDKSYVKAIHNGNNPEAIAEGFHPGFNLLGVRDGYLTKYPIYTWIESTRRRAEADKKPNGVTTAKYPMIDITNGVAIAKIELYKNGKQIFTDYLSLYKIKGKWKIVSKVYDRTPQ